ncbi:uncharacterized protein MYCFIDRAFT_83310 [Pseudocercospora fijiensis CIRAD86]|uniref:Uncharacterized protein n=1 Tax=Pseudocercospora fijiensis (strain CIRAD86) TaxID=383855 RepID=M2ZE24_PSEFD|nr:uncharacterized protein MYCFIDRAFT_83310 [Pseudocercospora fijiensis CIRAD86]EME77379.1 hypothetical protein MYCFIDRAFT_83310 [Pseudocercospora fijiensis CIRAD86]
MPSKRAVLSDLTSQLGLRAFYSKKGTDFKANPTVAQLWDKLTELCKVHYLKAMEYIPRCPEIRDAQANLLKEHGPAIWSADNQRPWLLNPGEGATSSPYARDLYWHDLADQKFIKETFLTFVVEKILRWRKDHIRTSRATSDNLFDPTYTSNPASTNTRTAHSDSPANWECFSVNREDHLNASLLSQSVWLGDYDQAKVSINGPTWNEVEKNYFESTTGGSECFGAEPHAFDALPGVVACYLQCAACCAAGRQPCERLKIWTFKCSLKGRDVYACLKELPEREWRRLKSDTPLWSFWKLNGGYTTNWFLTPVSENATTPLLQSDIIQHGPDKGKRKRQDSPQPEAKSTNPPKRTTRSSKSRSMIARKTAFNAINKHGGPAIPRAAVQSTESPHVVPRSTPTRGRQPSYDSLYDTTPAPQNKTQAPASASATSFFGRYTRPPYINAERPEATNPDPEASTHDATATTQATAFAPSTQHTAPTLPAETEHEAEPQPAATIEPGTNNTATSERPPTPGPAPPPSQSPQPSLTEIKPFPRSSSTMEPPPFTLRFPIWFKSKIRDSAASKVVYLDDSMTVQNVFNRLRKNLKRQIEGQKQPLVAIDLRFAVDGEALITVDEDDEDGWEMVLSMVKEAERKEMYGSLECQ